MTKKLIRQYTQNLRTTRDSKIGKVPPDIQAKINKIVDLYEDRKISRYETANKLINDISINDTKKRKSGLKRYDKAVAKYEESEPITERMAKTAKKARTGKEVKAVIKKHDKQPIFKRKAISGLATKAKDIFKNRKTYDVKFMLFSVANRDEIKKPSFILDGISYYPILLKASGKQRALGEANVKANQFIETVVSRKIRKYHKDEKGLYKRVMLLMNTSSEFDDIGHLVEYADAIRIESVELVETDTSNYDEREQPLREGQNISIYYRYIQTEVDADALTIKEALQKKEYKDNECWINALLENFEGTELTRAKKAHNAKTLSRNKILELLEMTEEEFINNGASITQMDRVFQFLNIPVRLYNFTGGLIYQHNPKDYEKGRVKMFRGLVKNNHIYLLNHDLNTLRQMQANEEGFKAPTTSRFYITDRNEPIKYKMFDDVDDLLKMRDEEEYALIHSDNDMVKVFFQLNEAGYKPYIKYGNSGQIANIMCKFYYKKLKKYIKYNIVSQSLSKDRIDEDVAVDDEDTYNNIVSAMFRFQKDMFKEIHLSYYNEVDIKILKECKTIVPVGRFHDTNVKIKKLREIDIRKAFTFGGCCIKYIPRFTEFDVFKPFADCDINSFNNLTLYIVEVYEGNIFFNKKYNLIYGKFLKQLLKRDIKLKILYYKQPNHVYKVNYKKIIDELYSTKISSNEDLNKQLQKKVANISIGMLEKSHNTSQKSSTFNSLREACYYQKLNPNSKIYTIGQYQTELEELEDDEMRVRDTEGMTYYVLNVSDKKVLSNGFTYIKELLLQYHNFKMYETYKTLTDSNIKVYSVKTDSLTIHEDDLDKVYGYTYLRKWREGLLKFGDEIGDWRLEEKHTITLPTQPYKYKFNELPEIPKIKNINISIEDEWNTESICKKVIKQNPVIIRGKFPGTGKSYIGQHFQKMNKNVLFVVPTNRQLQEIQDKGIEATTYNKFFSIAVHEDVGEKLPIYDYSPYDVIVFDEIYMLNLYTLNKVWQFMENNTHIIRIATGDVKQLEGVETMTNCQDPATYIDNCIDTMFKYNIFLKICKRVGAKDSAEGERNRKILNDMYNDWWENNIPRKEFILKYSYLTDDIMASEHNIAYTNMRCENVANEIRDRLNISEKYVVGDILVARTWIKQPRVNINLRYRITKIEDDELGEQITLQNIARQEDEFMLSEPIVDKNFIYPYCATCHSSQGSSVRESITIHEWDLPITSREWIWTALTRCVDFRKVKFYCNPEFDKQMDKNMIMRYFKNKVENYKIQDRRAKREITEEEYISAEWCLSQFRARCQKCNTSFNFETKKGKLCSNFTCQRLDNSIAHHIDNSTSFCVYCNVSAH